MPKRRKVEEAATPYAAKPSEKDPAGTGVKLANLEDVRETNAKLMQVHRKVLQKLAQ